MEFSCRRRTSWGEEKVGGSGSNEEAEVMITVQARA